METKIIFAHYGELREVNANADELTIFERLRDILADAGHARNRLGLFRRSDGYVTAGVDTGGKYDVVDVMRFKYTNRAKWIILPLISSKKIRISCIEDVDSYRDEIVRHYEDALKYVGK